MARGILFVHFAADRDEQLACETRGRRMAGTRTDDGPQRFRTRDAERAEQRMATDVADVIAQHLIHQAAWDQLDAADIHHLVPAVQAWCQIAQDCLESADRHCDDDQVGLRQQAVHICDCMVFWQACVGIPATPTMAAFLQQRGQSGAETAVPVGSSQIPPIPALPAKALRSFCSQASGEE